MKNLKKLYYQYFQVSLCLHCNLKCKECSHFAPFINSDYYSFEEFCKDLSKLGKIYSVERLRFLGGEPLLHPDIIKFIEFTKHLSFANQIGICTNGVFLEQVDESFYKSIDFIDISKHANIQFDYDKLIKYLVKKQEKYSFHFKVLEFNVFNRRNVTKPISSIHAIKNYSSCILAHDWHCHSIYKGHYYKCPRPIGLNEYISHYNLENTGINYKVEDSVLLHQNNLRNKLLKYINSKNPLSSCSWCLGVFENQFTNPNAEIIEHTQLTEDEYKTHNI